MYATQTALAIVVVTLSIALTIRHLPVHHRLPAAAPWRNGAFVCFPRDVRSPYPPFALLVGLLPYDHRLRELRPTSSTLPKRRAQARGRALWIWVAVVYAAAVTVTL